MTNTKTVTKDYIISDAKKVKEEARRLAVSDWENDPKMQEWEVKNISVVVKLTDGTVYTIDKPHINTDFCYGYGYCGISTLEDQKEAAEQANKARTDTKHFIDENMKELEAWTDTLDKYMNGGADGIYYKTKYINRDNNHIDLSCCRWDMREWHESNGYKKLSVTDAGRIYFGYCVAMSLFEKRLIAYLKRYGTSKINTWTYLVD